MASYLQHGRMVIAKWRKIFDALIFEGLFSNLISKRLLCLSTIACQENLSLIFSPSIIWLSPLSYFHTSTNAENWKLFQSVAFKNNQVHMKTIINLDYCWVGNTVACILSHPPTNCWDDFTFCCDKHCAN